MGGNEHGVQGKIIEMVNEIDRKDILRYIYIIISDIVKEEKEREKDGSK